MKTCTALFAAIFVTACSTTPVTEQSAKLVPSERVYAPTYMATAVAPNKAVVSFFRDSGFFGSGCSHDVFVNNTKVFSIRQGEFIHLSLDPGPYFFRLETGGGLCPNIATSQNTVLKEGGKETYRILLPSDGSLRLTRTE